MNSSSFAQSSSPSPTKAALWAACLLLPFIIAWVYTAVVYCLSPCYIDHIEASVPVISQQWLHGRPLYHDPTNSPYLYSLLYGPACFLSTAFWLGFFPDPILASKVSGTFWAFLSLAFIFYACRSRFGTWPAVAGSGAMVFTFFHFSNPLHFSATLWDRSDPILIASASLALVGSSIRNRPLAALIFAAGLGLAISSKIHGFLYLLPAGAIWWRQYGWRSLFPALIAGGLVALLPFLLPEVSLRDYLSWLRLSAAHPLLKSLLVENLQALVVILIPLVLLPRPIDAAKQTRWLDEENLLFLSVVGAGVLVCIPASKAGAGQHHILPFAPYVGYLFAKVLANDRHAQNVWSLSLGFLWLISTYPQMVYLTRPLRHCTYNGAAADVIEDLHSILTRYDPRGIQMGCGGEHSYAFTFSSPWIYKSGAPRLVDVVTCMEMKAAGLNLQVVEKSLRDRKATIWLIPHGDRPFSMISFYDQMPLFADSVGQTFLQNYSIVESTHYYDVYQANSLSQ